MRVAIIHDWLNGNRGGEKILGAITALYPEADIYTLFYEPGTVGTAIERLSIRASVLNRLPGVRRYYRWLLPFFPLAIESFQLKGYDLVISSSHCVAKGVRVPKRAVHICYCHTPMRYAWDLYDEYFKGLMAVLVYPFIRYLRWWDARTAGRVDHFIANSSWIQKRIDRCYGRRSEVIHPFVDLEGFHPLSLQVAPSSREPYYLVVSAFAPYKRIDVAIRACQRLGRKLHIVGGGQDEAKLRAIAGSETAFLGKVPQSVLLREYAGCEALLFPGEEDFGITPLEAMACGKPVIALRRGGVTDSVVEGETGLFFSEASEGSLADAILRFEASRTTFLPARCREQALRFNRAAFLASFQESVARAVQRGPRGDRAAALDRAVPSEAPSPAS